MIFPKIYAEWSRLNKALHYSLEGFSETFQVEAAFKTECILAAFMIPLALILPIGLSAKLLMVVSVFMVLITELLNSGLEWTINYISEKRHPLAKRVKDIGSAAVFLSLIQCGFIWAVVLISLI